MTRIHGKVTIEIELQDARTSIDPSETESSQEKRFIPIDEVPEKTRSSLAGSIFALRSPGVDANDDGGRDRTAEAHSEMKFRAHHPYPNPNP